MFSCWDICLLGFILAMLLTSNCPHCIAVLKLFLSKWSFLGKNGDIIAKRSVCGFIYLFIVCVLIIKSDTSSRLLFPA